ncbi:Ig-like domain-containing protein [Clostridium intestinale]|uniref:Ig-like domain-containing protein n=1 Tax=Clostridium intestinale TaxID=36845 RepID=UPI0028E81CEA|nr:Ig-like domain-containing protein [Clostridium intestinale]
MKIQSKKKFIAFSLVVILATIFSLTWIQGSNASAATVGQQLTTPEAGWRRYDDADSKIIFPSYAITSNANNLWYNSTLKSINSNFESQDAAIKFKFYGSKFRIITLKHSDRSSMNSVFIDGVEFNYSEKLYQGDVTPDTDGRLRVYRALVFEKLNLSQGIHTVEIRNKTNEGAISLDAIDIDSDGYLVDSSTVFASEISLNKTSLSLNVGQTEDLIETVKPDNAENKNVTWSSSDESIATVDENGKVTAIKPGNVTITVKTTDGSNLTATCDVTVVQPSNDRGILAITMTNGQTKEYDLPNSEIEAFTNWFDSSNGKGQPKFGFNKKIQPYKEVKEYVVFDKISSYEVRTYTVSN